MHRIEINTRDKVEFLDVTGEIQRLISNSTINNGICYIFVPHTTAGITLNEHADPDVTRDIINRLSVVVPDKADYRHVEGNSQAHIKASLMGHSKVVFVENRKLVLGTWQGIFFCEFDGPRRRQILVKIISG